MVDAGHRRTALLVAACFFMENLDGTIVTTAAPAVASSLHVPVTSVGLVITAYLLTLAVLVPVSGWLTQRFGARRVFLTAIVVFTGASAACAASQDLAQLVAFRVVQGAGGAMMVPVGRLLVLARTDRADLVRVIAWITWPGLVAPVVAPLVGGLLTTYASWRWLFLVNLPLGAVALAAAWRLVRAEERGSPLPLDRAGVLLTCSGVTALAWTGHLLSQPTSPWAPAAGWGVLALALLTAAVRHQLRTPAPLVELRTLLVPTFRASIIGVALFWLVVGAVPFLLPLLFQGSFGWSPVRSGAVVLFLFAGNLAIKPSTTPLLRRFGFRTVLLVATSGVAVTTAAAGALTASTPVVVVAGLAVLSGVARSVGFTAYNVVGLVDIPPERLRDANTLTATTQQLFGGLGIAAATVALRAGGSLERLAPGAAGSAGAYPVAFVLLAGVALLATAAATRLHARAGASVR